MDLAKNLHEAVTSLLQKHTPSVGGMATPPPPPAPDFVQNVVNNSTEAGSGISLLVSMTYQSLSGNMRSRDILIRRVIRAKGDYYIDGVAMDKYAPRLIKFSHIRGIRDVSSGKVYYNPYEFAQNRLGIQVSLPEVEEKTPEPLSPPNDFAKVIERTGHEMTALMYLVAIDGQRDKAEREKVFEYIKSRTSDLKYNDEDLNDYLISLAPDRDCFETALNKALTQEQTIVQGFVEAILDIIMADGKVDPKERDFLVNILDLLEKEGYDISVPI